MPVAAAGRVGKLGGSLLDEELPLRPGIVLLGEYTLDLSKDLVLLARHALPALLEPVDRIALQSRDYGLEAAEVLEDPELLGDVDPGLDNSGALLGLGLVAAIDTTTAAEEHTGDDAQRYGVELVNGGENRGCVVITRSVSPRPNSSEALVSHQFAEDLGIHACQLLGEVSMGHLRERVARPAVAERVVAVDGSAVVCGDWREKSIGEIRCCTNEHAYNFDIYTYRSGPHVGKIGAVGVGP